MGNKETIWDEDYSKQYRDYIEKMTKEFNDRCGSGGIVTLREVFESLGFRYDDTNYAKTEKLVKGRWQYGGSLPELHFETKWEE